MIFFFGLYTVLAYVITMRILNKDQMKSIDTAELPETPPHSLTLQHALPTHIHAVTFVISRLTSL